MDMLVELAMVTLHVTPDGLKLLKIVLEAI